VFFRICCRNFINNLVFSHTMNEALFVYKNEITNLQLDLMSASVDVSKGTQDIGSRVGKMLARAHLVSNAIHAFIESHETIVLEDSARIAHFLDSIAELHHASFDLAQKYSFELRYQ